MAGRILIVDDDRGMCEVLATGLTRRGFQVTVCTSPVEAIEVVRSAAPSAVVTDQNMPEMTGLELCERLSNEHPDLPVVVMTALGRLETAIAAIRQGAYDFVTKPFDVDTLALMLSRAVRHRELAEEVSQLRRALADASHLGDLVGRSPAMQRVYEVVSQVAHSDASVLITGESGTGKELVARALHDLSRRKSGPFVPINCAALPEALLESELFGHVRGAFTSAVEDKAGLLVRARGGTLFLDEIGEMPLGLQPKLLRALQERRVRPVGANEEVAVDTRIVAATNLDLESALEDKRFREDLYFRINVIPIELPPLRARGADILLLAQHFLERSAKRQGHSVVGISSEAAERLLSYSWPGNVRELGNCIEGAVALARYEQIRVDDLPEKIRSYRSNHLLLASEAPSDLVPLEEVKRRYILRVLEATGGNRTQAAQILGLDRKTLYHKLEKYRS
jgi:two-component system response regulator HydG